ncbi:MAG: hypothetical protein R3332_08480 [Pseudohongiellaceae bacterium]|nr:hypothetical protein [Pseudohongiellaceae bacterium]
MDEFSFKVHANRWGSTSTYKVRKTDTGWHVAHIAINGDCEPDGSPFLYSNFKQDHICYPSGLGNQLEWLWRQIDECEIDWEDAQEKLQELGDWVSTCEKAEPLWSGWNL